MRRDPFELPEKLPESKRVSGTEFHKPDPYAIAINALIDYLSEKEKKG